MTISRSVCGIELPVAEGGLDLQADHVVEPAAHQEADQQQPAVPVRQALAGPHLGEEVLDGDAEEVAVAVADLPAVDLAHGLEAEAAALRIGVHPAHRRRSSGVGQ